MNPLALLGMLIGGAALFFLVNEQSRAEPFQLDPLAPPRLPFNPEFNPSVEVGFPASPSMTDAEYVQALIERGYDPAEFGYDVQYVDYPGSAPTNEELETVQRYMELSFNGLQAIAQREGFRASVYKDQAGLPTIGYGHLIKPGESFTTISEDEAASLLAEDIATAENAVNSYVTVPLTQGQFDALVSLVFNIGDGAFLNSSLLRLLNNGDYSGAKAQIGAWNKITVNGQKVASAGLTTRRSQEMNQFG